jgi:PIN domain nuclease of toxin-antitoxin system
MIYLDTHIIIWLYAGLRDKLSTKVVQAIEENELLISAIVPLEIEFLYEVKKISYPANKIINDLKKRIGLQICGLSFQDIAEQALALSWTRDPFDRLIVANAMAQQLPLLTKDKTIIKHYKQAIW